MGTPFVWFDVTATGDGDDVRDFYTGLFGWPAAAGAGDYRSWFADGGQPWAGVLPGGTATAGRWIPFVVVADLDAAAKEATALGGSVVREKTTGPAGTSVLVADPGGAVVGLFVPAG